MTHDLSKLLVTVLFAAILVILFFWLIKTLLPGFRQGKKNLQKDDFDSAGYETITRIQRKERSVMALSGLIIVICLLLFGGLIYRAFTSFASGGVESENILNLAMAFIPPIIILALVMKTSSRYMRKQQETLREFRLFQAKRGKALAEYQQKRRGRESERQKAAVQFKENSQKKTGQRKRKETG